MPKQYLSKNQRLLVFKFIGLIAMIRWYNIALIMVAQYLASLFLLTPADTKLEVLLDYKLHLVIFSTAFIIAAGYIINSFYDVERDTINRPEKTVFDRLISKQFSLNCYVIFNIIGLCLCVFISYKILIFHTIFIFGLWLYSHKLHKLPFIAELSASLLTVSAFFSICLYYQYIDLLILVYGSYIFLINLIREVSKNFTAIKGDVLYGYTTTVVYLGVRVTKFILLGLIGMSFMLPIAFYYLINESTIQYFFMVSMAVSAFLAILIYRARANEFELINTILKILLLISIGSIVLI